MHLIRLETFRRLVLGIAALALATVPLSNEAQVPAGYPSKTIRFVVPYAAGGLPDTVARIVAQRLQEKVGQPVVVENRPGANGAVAAAALSTNAADGYTFLVTDGSMFSINPKLYSKLGYNATQDFVPVALVARAPLFLATNPKLPVNSFKEFVAYVKANPGKLNYGSPGIGTGGHLVTELLVKRTSMDAQHIPYQSTSQQVLAAAGGHLHFTFDTPGNARGLVESGKLRPLAVTGSRRTAFMPDVPTFEELGHQGFDLFVWNGLMAPAGTPPAIIEALNREALVCQQKPEVKTRMEQGSYEPGMLKLDAFAALIDKDLKTWTNVVRETGVQIKA